MNSHQNELARGWQLHQAKQLKAAESIYRKVVDAAPQNANAWCYLGMSLHDQRRYPEAVDTYRQALKIQPEFPIVLNNLGNSLRYVQEVEESDACFQRALDLKPDYLNAYKNRGTLHVWTGNLERGLAYYQEALKINPNEAELHRNLGVIYLLQGKFEQGWREYRWRWRVGDLHRPIANLPVWDGGQVRGKSLLLTAEQGLGDTLHFVRFAKLLREQGAQTLVYCQPQLVALLQGNPELGPIYPNSLAPNCSLDAQGSLLDAADLLNINADNIPNQVPYIHPPENLCAYWQQQFPTDLGRTRIGIAWQGNPDHQADAFRSVPLKYFERLAARPDVELISLQNGFGTEQLDRWQGKSPIRTLDSSVDKSSGAFMDTAAIMKSLDLVITSDTSIAHLAGALGVPTWIALGYIPDWRWLLERDDSPWYPTARLFRQPSMGDWNSVFERMAVALSDRIDQNADG